MENRQASLYKAAQSSPKNIQPTFSEFYSHDMMMKQLKYLVKSLKKLASMVSGSGSKVKQENEQNYAFMNIAIKIDLEGPGWQKIVAKVLNGIRGVSNFNMEDDGTVVISGTVNPPLLLKRLAKAGTRASIKHWQYGQCSSNMYTISNPYTYNNGYYSQGHGYDYSANRGYGYGYSRYGGDDYGYPPYVDNAYGYGGNGGRRGHYGLGHEQYRY